VGASAQGRFICVTSYSHVSKGFNLGKAHLAKIAAQNRAEFVILGFIAYFRNGLFSLQELQIRFYRHKSSRLLCKKRPSHQKGNFEL
jgi:hypothetical protein